MNFKDAANIYKMIRKEYPPNVLPPEVLQQIIDILLSYIGSACSEGDKAESKSCRERLNPKDHTEGNLVLICDSPNTENK